MYKAASSAEGRPRQRGTSTTDLAHRGTKETSNRNMASSEVGQERAGGQSEITQYVELQRAKKDEHRGRRTNGHEMCRGQPRVVEATSCGYGDGDIRQYRGFVCLFQVFSGVPRGMLPGYFRVAHHM
jgi:hypothetical protein